MTPIDASVGRPSGRHPPQTYADLLQSATQRLADALGLERREARIEARVLLAHALGVEHAWLLAHDLDPPEPARADAIEALLARRERGEPVAYILGEREFFGHVFRVTPDVLIPRPETELLVETALARLPKDQSVHVLDLGTGSGCVALTLALERPRAQVVAVDISPAALAIAQNNARRLGAANVAFMPSDWYAELGVKKFDMIVGNPPYIALGDPHLHRGDLRFEPRQALSSGSEGMDALRAIISGAAAHLEPGGWLLLEHGLDQATHCASLLLAAGFTQVTCQPDWAQLDRISLGRLPG